MTSGHSLRANLWITTRHRAGPLLLIGTLHHHSTSLQQLLVTMSDADAERAAKAARARALVIILTYCYRVIIIN